MKASASRLLVENLREATRQWSWTQYGLLVALWIFVAVPFYIHGMGVLSILAPLVVLAAALTVGATLVWGLNRLTTNVGAPRPVVETWHDSILGVFERRDGSDEFIGTMTWHERSLELCLSPGEFSTKQAVAAAAKELSLNEGIVDAAAGSFLVEELLDVVNEQWLPEGASVRDAKSFLAEISLRSLTSYGDGYYALMFDAGDLLGGHWIEVLGSIEGGPVDAEIIG